MPEGKPPFFMPPAQEKSDDVTPDMISGPLGTNRGERIPPTASVDVISNQPPMMGGKVTPHPQGARPWWAN